MLTPMTATHLNNGPGTHDTNEMEKEENEGKRKSVVHHAGLLVLTCMGVSMYIKAKGIGTMKPDMANAAPKQVVVRH